MNKLVYVLTEDVGELKEKIRIRGVVSEHEISQKWEAINWNKNDYYEIEIDDPELLVRISKSELKK